YRTKIESFIYVVLFTLTMNALFIYSYANWIYVIILNALCIYWLYLGVIGFKAENDQLWAKRYFLFSVLLITIISISFSFTSTLPANPIVFFLKVRISIYLYSLYLC